MIHPIFKPGPEWTPEEAAQAMELLLPDLIHSAEIVVENARQRLHGQSPEDEPPAEPAADWQTYEAGDWALVYLENQFTRDLLDYRPLGHRTGEVHIALQTDDSALFRRMGSGSRMESDETGSDQLWHFRSFFRHAFHDFCQSVQRGERRKKERPPGEIGGLEGADSDFLLRPPINVDRADALDSHLGFDPGWKGSSLCSAGLREKAGELFAGNRLRFRHPTLRQAILDHASQREFLAAHVELARGCLRCWKLEDSPARDYAVRWATYHLEAAGMGNQARGLLLNRNFLTVSLQLAEGIDRLIDQVEGIAGDDQRLIELADTLHRNRIDLTINPAQIGELDLLLPE